MYARRWTAILAFLSVSASALGSNVDGIILSHHEPLERISVYANNTQGSQKPQGIGPVILSFDALGRSFDLQLEPNAGLLAAMSGSRFASDIVPYRGQIAGEPDSWVRIVLTDGMPAGLVWDGQSLLAIEIPGDSLVNATAPVTYRLSDVIVAPGALSCAGGASVTSGAAVYKALLNNLDTAMAQGPGAVSEINVGAIGDYEFTTARGANAQSAIITRLNNVDGIFSQQLGVQINVPVVETYPVDNDPFGTTTDPGTLLTELGSYRQLTPSQNSQGLTHLYTGRDLDGTTVGIAYTSALCNTTFGAGLSEGNGSSTFDSLVTAHEIGHNFGAPHDGVVGSACEAEPSTFIMATNINGSNQFSACSIAEMQDDIAAASCITALPSTDISLRFNEPDATVLLSNTARVTIDIINNGTEVAENVVAGITLPSIVSYIDASGSGATCVPGAGTVTCQLGDVAGGSAATIAVSTDTLSVGVDSFDAVVTADADDNAGNNADSVQLTVNPAVNLVVNAPTATPVLVDQSTTITAMLDNLSPLDATGVTLSISLDTGLRADTATWSIGTCSVAAQQVDCQAAQFDAQSSSTLNIGVTGLTKGNRNFTVSLASVEADADMADNNVQGSVRVNSENNKGDSGGGTFGWLLLLMLSWAAFHYRRQSTGASWIH